MVPHQELFVTLETVLAFSVIWWVTLSRRRIGSRFRRSSEQSIRWTFVSTSCTSRTNFACLCSAPVRRNRANRRCSSNLWVARCEGPMIHQHALLAGRTCQEPSVTR